MWQQKAAEHCKWIANKCGFLILQLFHLYCSTLNKVQLTIVTQLNHLLFPPSKSKTKLNYFPWPNFSRYTFFALPTESDRTKTLNTLNALIRDTYLRRTPGVLAPAVFKSFSTVTMLSINKTDTSVRRATSLLKPSKDRWEVVYIREKYV